MPSRYGLIGCGSAGRNRHLRATSANPRIDPVAVCDLNEERADDAAAERDPLSLSVYTDAVEMIDIEGLDVVSVATPPGTHHSVVTEIAHTGVSMLVEKPFATTAERADEMLAACSKHDSTVTEVNNQLFYPTVREVKKKTENGDLGKIRNVISVMHSDASTSIESRPGWISSIPGQLYGEQLPHRIYLMRHFLGSIEDVRSVAKTPALDEIPESVGEISVHVDGHDANGYIMMSLQATCPEVFLIIGSKKSLLLDHDHRFYYEIEKSETPRDLLAQNAKTAGSILWRTAKRAALYLGTEYLRDRTSVTAIQDIGYYSDGHYYQLTELVSSNADDLTVGSDEIRANTKVYDITTSAIDEEA